MRLVPVLGAAALTLALSGCSLLGFGADDSQPEPKKSHPTQVAEVDKVLKAVKPITGDKDSVPSTKKFFTTMLDAGYAPEQLEATIDESPLGNDVPSKMFGVKTDKGCVIGEIRGGKATAELMKPTESTGSCLFGEVDRPEGVKAPEGGEARRGRRLQRCWSPSGREHQWRGRPDRDLAAERRLVRLRRRFRLRRLLGLRGIDRISGFVGGQRFLLRVR